MVGGEGQRGLFDCTEFRFEVLNEKPGVGSLVAFLSSPSTRTGTAKLAKVPTDQSPRGLHGLGPPIHALCCLGARPDAQPSHLLSASLGLAITRMESGNAITAVMLTLAVTTGTF